MNNALRIGLLLFLITGAASFAEPTAANKRAKASGAWGYPPQFGDARTEVYKTIGDVTLSLYIFNPGEHTTNDTRAAIVLFFGGGWTSGSPKQFEQTCRYFASRGMVAITADYRVASRHHAKAVSCVTDAKSAIRWVRAHAKRLGIDPNRIAAGGGSAGGHIAACTGTIAGLDEVGEDVSVSSVPNAMVLFNPALVLAPIEGSGTAGNGRTIITSEKLGIEPAKLSPFHNVRAGAPPTIIFHGKADTTVPYSSAEAFAEAMKKAGNRCELAGFEGQQHGFFNFGRGDNKFFVETLRLADRFLASINFLKGAPTIDLFVKTVK